MFFQLLFNAASVPPATSTDTSAPWAIMVLIVIVLVLVGVGIVAAKRRSGHESDWDLINRKKMTASFEEAKALARSGTAAGRKLAVIEADKLLDHALKALGTPGETMADRLKVAQYQYPKIQDVWTAHKWRNQLVHEAHFSLSERQTEQAMRDFESALRTLRVLL